MTLEELIVIVKVVSTGGGVLWGGTVAIVVALWRRVLQQERRIAKLQEQASDGNAIKDLASGCGVPHCPIRAAIASMSVFVVSASVIPNLTTILSL